MGGGNTTTTQSTNSEPWSAQQPNLQTGISDAKTLYDAGVGSGPYMGSTVIPYSQQSMAGMNDIQNQAASNMGGAGISGQAQNIINNGGMSNDQMQSMNYLNSVGDNAFDLSGNQTYQNYRSNALDDVQNRVNGSASAAGRYGSGMHSGALTEQLSDAGTSMDMAQFARNDSLNNQRFNAGQTAMGNLGSAYDLGQKPAGSMMDIGGMYEDLAGRVKNDELRIYDGVNNAPWKNLGNLMAVTSGAGQYGSSQTTSQQPGQNPFLTAAGYGLSGLGLLGGL